MGSMVEGEAWRPSCDEAHPITRGSKPLQAHHRHARDAHRTGRRAGEVDDAAADEGTAVVDADHDRSAAGPVCHQHARPEGKGPMRRRERSTAGGMSTAVPRGKPGAATRQAGVALDGALPGDMGQVMPDGVPPFVMPMPMPMPRRTDVTKPPVMPPATMAGTMVPPVAAPVTMPPEMPVSMMSEVIAVRFGGTATTQESKNAKQNQYRCANHYASLQRQGGETTRPVYQESKHEGSANGRASPAGSTIAASATRAAASRRPRPTGRPPPGTARHPSLVILPPPQRVSSTLSGARRLSQPSRSRAGTSSCSVG